MQVTMTVGRGCHQKAARGGWGAASLGRLRTDPIFDSGDRGPGTTRELPLIFRRGTLFSKGGGRSSTCPKDFSLGDGVTAPLIYLQVMRLSVTYRDASADVMPTFLICVNPVRVPAFRNLLLSRYLATIS